MPRAFAIEEEEHATLLAAAGLDRPAARCLVAVLRLRKATATEIAAAAEIARQEVSAGMRALEAQGLVEVERVRRPEGGRPTNLYRLAAQPDDALRRLSQERRRTILRELAMLDELEKRVARA